MFPTYSHVLTLVLFMTPCSHPYRDDCSHESCHNLDPSRPIDSLTALPIDIHNHIIEYLTIPPESVPFSFDTCYNPDLINLSSTCTFFRQYLGPRIFPHISLVRTNHVDSILSVPKSFEAFSAKHEYYRQLIRETLYLNFSECTNSELAKGGFRLVKDSKEASRYQDQFCIVSSVRYLECGKELITSGNINLFNSIVCLKLLDNAIGSTDVVLKLPYLKYLALNIINLSVFKSIIPQLVRLDLFIDFSEATIEHLTQLSTILGNCHIAELNIFLSESSAIIYKPVVDIIAASFTPNLKKLGLRVIRRSFNHYSTIDHDIIDDNDMILLDCLRNSQLTHFTIDESFLDFVNIYGTWSSEASSSSIEIPRILTIVDPSVIVPRILDSTKIKLEIIVNLLNITHLNLQYGDPMSQSDVSALSQLSDFVLFYYLRHNRWINTVSVQQVWSTANESVLRDLIRDSMFEYQQNKDIQELRKLNGFRPWHRLPFNTPNFKEYHQYEVKHSGNDVSLARVLSDNYVPNNFWSLETTLCELEQYGRKERKLSSIWD